MSTSKKASPSRARQLPRWLRILLVLSPVCICLPLTGTAVFVAFRQINVQAANSTIAALQTLSAAETAGSRERLQATAEAATAAAGSRQAAEDATATALAASLQAPTQLPTPTVLDSTPTPAELITLTLFECRGNDGVVFLDNSQGQELLAFTSISFKVTRGGHTLEIVWADDPDNNVETQLNLQQDTALVYGDPCS